MAPNLARSARIARMNLTRDNRLSLALVLYLCTLVSLLPSSSADSTFQLVITSSLSSAGRRRMPAR